MTRHLLRKTFYGLWLTVAGLLIVVLLMVTWIAHTMGSIEGYRLGIAKAEASNPLKAMVESGRPFVYDNGVAIPVKSVRGKKAPYYIIRSEK